MDDDANTSAHTRGTHGRQGRNTIRGLNYLKMRPGELDPQSLSSHWLTFAAADPQYGDDGLAHSLVQRLQAAAGSHTRISQQNAHAPDGAYIAMLLERTRQSKCRFAIGLRARSRRRLLSAALADVVGSSAADVCVRGSAEFRGRKARRG